jgi:SAM-dependent methyltransferase
MLSSGFEFHCESKSEDNMDIRQLRNVLPKRTRYRIRRLISGYRYRQYLREPLLENIPQNTFAFSFKYLLSMSGYFNDINNWKLDKSHLRADERMSLQHFAMVDFLRNSPLSSDARFLDVCCGMGHLFLYLKFLLGYSHFVGIDDSSFQPGITDAAKDFLAYYRTQAQIVDVNNVAFPPHYFTPAFSNRFDVFSHFVVDTYYFFPIAYEVLKVGGLYIAELEDIQPGVYSDVFRVLKVYEGYGRVKESGLHRYHTVVMQKIK